MNLRTEILVNNVYLDLFEDIPLNLTYLVQDIRTPDKRNTAFSKTIKIPGSPKNNKLFTHLFELDYDIQTSGLTNFSPDFNPNLKANVTVFVDSVEQFTGILKLDNIVKVNNDRLDYKIEYHCTIFGKLANIFSNMGDAMLTDLNISTYNHTYNQNAITASWTATKGQGYYYPMIDYGTTNGANYDVIDFKPAIYAKQLIDSIFQYAGFQYTSTFLNSAFFKSLVIPFSGDKLILSNTQVLQRLFRASMTSLQETILTVANGIVQNVDTVIFNDDTTAPDFDSNNQYDPSTGIFTAAKTGNYSFFTKVTVSFRYQPSVADYVNLLKVDAEVWKTDLSNANSIPSTSTTVNFQPTAQVNPGDISSSFDLSVNAPNIYLQAGEKVRIKVRVQNNGQAPLFQNTTGSIYWRANVNSFFYDSVVNSGLFEGDIVDMNAALPQNIKMSEYFKGIINLFHLFVEEDKNTPNKLIIEPYIDYYTAGVTQDWTKKIDISSPIEVTPMGALDAKRYRFKYKDDEDYWNKFYRDKWLESYGEKYLDITNDFLKDEKITEVIFSPTPLVQIPAYDRIIPAIYAVDANGQAVPKAANIRILINGGLIATNNPWDFTSSSGITTYSQYPYAGHLDNPLTPSIDLSFGVPREVFYDINSTSYYTNNNLYNKYYSQYISEITDRNSKIITASFYLTPADINQLSFQDKYFIDGIYYRLNKVIEYNPVITALTKCELLQIKDGVPFSSTQAKVYGGSGTIGQDSAPANSRFGSSTNTASRQSYNGNAQRNFVSGTGNRVSDSAVGVIVTGTNNSVGDNAQRISIFNSSGVSVIGGVTDCTIMNSSGVTVTESGVTVISNVFYKASQSKIKIVTSNYTVSLSDEIILCNGTLTINTPKSSDYLNKRYLIKNIGSGTVTINNSTYDGAASLTINVQYKWYEILFSGQLTGYYIISSG